MVGKVDLDGSMYELYLRSIMSLLRRLRPIIRSWPIQGRGLLTQTGTLYPKIDPSEAERRKREAEKKGDDGGGDAGYVPSLYNPPSTSPDYGSSQPPSTSPDYGSSQPSSSSYESNHSFWSSDSFAGSFAGSDSSSNSGGYGGD